jgi:hypothetical protein
VAQKWGELPYNNNNNNNDDSSNNKNNNTAMENHLTEPVTAIAEFLINSPWFIS